MSATQELNLAQKLAAACDEVGGIEKKGVNEAQRYKYVKAADVAKAIRHELFQRGVVIVPNEVECTTKQISFQNAKGEQRNSNEVVLKTAYVITDGTETLTMHGYGIAWDSGDKALYKAKTGALKYFLRGLGLIPDEKDDPEADESVDRAVNGKQAETEEEFDQRTESQRCIQVFQIQAIDEACKRTGKTEAEVLAYLGLIGHKRIEHLLRAEFNDFLKWANSTAKPKPAAKGPAPTEQARLVAMKRLFAVAGEHRVPEEDIKAFAYENFSVSSMSELSVLQIDETLKWVKEVAAEQTA